MDRTRKIFLLVVGSAIILIFGITAWSTLQGFVNSPLVIVEEVEVMVPVEVEKVVVVTATPALPAATSTSQPVPATPKPTEVIEEGDLPNFGVQETEKPNGTSDNEGTVLVLRLSIRLLIGAIVALCYFLIKDIRR